MLKHILFDNDGTLVDSEIIAVRASLSLLGESGFRMSEAEYSRRFPGLLERDILDIISREYGIRIPDDYFNRLRTLHVEGFKRELRAIAGMPTIFKNLKTPKSVVSNGSAGHVDRCLRHVRLRHALDGSIFSAEQVERPKPHPDVFELALETLRLKPQETLVVEDSPTGVTAAKKAGLRVVGFLGAAHIFDGHDEKLLECGADHIAADAKELTSLFEQYGVL
ncbi:MAG: HAD family phosphatase [Lewinellaceae bacterium]|nr:HAD family phosphatase [Lewinellaceae bacterium]